MADKVNGAAGKLIKRGAEIQDEIKLLQGEFSDIKLKLADKHIDATQSGSFVASNGAVLDLTEKKQYQPISAADTLAALKAERLGKHFPDVVKVMATPLKKFLPETVIAKLRKQKASAISWSFK